MNGHSEISARTAEGLSVAIINGINRQEVSNYFETLLQVMTDNDLLAKPDKIFNIDEKGVQVNNKTEWVLASKLLPPIVKKENMCNHHFLKVFHLVQTYS